MCSTPSMEITPQPRSTKAPKGSRWVTTAGRTIPGRPWESRRSRARRWARRRERRGCPSGPPLGSSTKKETGRPTRERIAMSRVVPSAMPRAVSARGMNPRPQFPRETVRLCSASQSRAVPSRTRCCSIARRSPSGVEQAARSRWYTGAGPRVEKSVSRRPYPFKIRVSLYTPLYAPDRFELTGKGWRIYNKLC